MSMHMSHASMILKILCRASENQGTAGSAAPAPIFLSLSSSMLLRTAAQRLVEGFALRATVDTIGGGAGGAAAGAVSTALLS